MEKRRKKHIEKLADSLLSEFAIANPGFNVYELLERLQVKWVHKDLGQECAGASMVDNDKKVISINLRLGLDRRRFAAAHELGHLELHKDKSLNMNNSAHYRVLAGDEWRDIEANYFASCLLIPEKLLQRELIAKNWNTELDEDKITTLATTFKVSPITMSFRLANLGFI